MPLTMPPLEREFLINDTESEDEDNHLLVDWKGNGGRVTLVQQSLPFKQVKRRDGLKTTSSLLPTYKETHIPTVAPGTISTDVITPEDKSVVVKPILGAVETIPDVLSRPKLVVSLSDSDVSAPPRSAIKRPSNNSHRLNPSGTGNVVCLDSDTDSEQSFQRCRLAPCSASQQPNLLENVVELDDEAENNDLLDDDGPMWSPPRVSSANGDCTLDPFGSGRSDFPIGEGSTFASSSKRPASSLWNRCNSGKGLDYRNDEDNLTFPSSTLEPTRPNEPETSNLNLDTNFSTLRAHTQVPEIHNVQEVQAGGTRKKRKTARGIPMTEEEKAFERSEMLRAKEAERLRKSEEKAEVKRRKEEEKKKLQEDNRRKREEEKLRKEAAREEAKERRRLEHEKKRWENGKFALQNTRALIDTKIIENGVIGGHLLNKLADKQLQYQLVSNPCPRSIMWRMKRPSEDSSGEAASRFWNAEDADSQTEGPSSKTTVRQVVFRGFFGLKNFILRNQELSLGSATILLRGIPVCRIPDEGSDHFLLVLEEVDVPYILFVLEAEEFAGMVGGNTLHTLINSTQARYPGFTICFLVNKLKWYLNKKEQTHYKSGDTVWKRPPVEKAIARLLTHHNGVHSRLCLDEAEVAEHVTGLMRSLADCPFKEKSTSLSVSKNGDHVTTSDTFKEEIKKSLWLKALVALPHTPGAVALAVAKRYGTMRALLKVYLDPTITVHHKELLLQDLVREGVFGPEQRRRVGPTCSRRIYRIFMAQNGNLKTDDVEQGADHFDESD